MYEKYSPKINRKYWFRGLVLTVLIIEMFLYTWCRVQYLQHGYDIHDLEKRIEHLISLKNELQIEQARLRSPERIIQIAKKQLHLQMPTPYQIVDMGK